MRSATADGQALTDTRVAYAHECSSLQGTKYFLQRYRAQSRSFAQLCHRADCPYSSVMDAPNPSAIPTAASRAPVHIGAVGMMVSDLDRVTAYYRDMLGLTVQEHTRQAAILGVGGVVLLELIHRPDALPDDPREAGLYHTAFLMPTRADLARWILHAAKSRVPFTGASDHDVSEAIYLDDPEGNGVEVYSDRPREKWRRDGELIFQKTDPLDIDAIIREVDPATATYPSAPEGLRIGHIHLRVGNVARAEAFYGGGLGLDAAPFAYAWRLSINDRACLKSY
jgi:catechol 2,3-dioxygenase